MQTREYVFEDKSTWGDGPWQQEPDKRQWQDPATGMPCLLVRNHSGAWCGYVGMGAKHPLRGKGYDAISSLLERGVHGGLTFTGPCDTEAPQDRGICHHPDPGEPDDVQWVGFDCSHSMDYCPALEARLRDIWDKMGQKSPTADIESLPSYIRPRYREIRYAASETTELARQLHDLAGQP